MLETPKKFNINGTIVLPGEEASMKLQVMRLPSGNLIQVKAHVYRSVHPGPVALLIGGMHGDEINGVEIVRKMIQDNAFKDLQCGSVIAIPVLNIYGFNYFSRDVSDGKDVNRSFPGNLKGSLASRVARLLTKNFLPLADFVVDFHTGGRALFNVPQIRYAKRFPAALELVKQFAPPFAVIKSPIPGSLRKVAQDMKIPVLVFEGGESMRYDGHSIEIAINGVQRLLIAKGMLPQNNGYDPPATVWIKTSSWLRASTSGLFQWYKTAGQPVSKGEKMGEINDPFGDGRVFVFAPNDGFIIGHNNAPVITQGDALFHMGYPN